MIATFEPRALMAGTQEPSVSKTRALSAWVESHVIQMILKSLSTSEGPNCSKKVRTQW